MNRTIKIIENEIRNHTSGCNVAEVVEVFEDRFIVSYREKRLFGRFSGPVEVGQFYTIFNVFCSFEHEKFNHEISIETTNVINCAALGELLKSETLEIVRELIEATKRLRSTDNNFIQNIPGAQLVAYPHADPDYPGIAIDVIPNSDVFQESAVLVEYNDDEGIVIHIWEQDKEDSVCRRIWTKQ